MNDMRERGGRGGRSMTSPSPGRTLRRSACAALLVAASWAYGYAADRATAAGDVVPDPCAPRSDAGSDDLCARLAGVARDGTTRFLRDEATGELWLLRVGRGVPAERARWLAQHGARVRVAGRVGEEAGLRSIAVEEVWRAHDHDLAPHGGVIGMSGDRHVELVGRVGGEVRVYLLDAFMQPLDVAAASGSARIRDRAGRAREGRLTPAPERGGLVVTGESRRADDDDVTVDVDLGGARILMTLPFPSGADAAPGRHDHGAHGHH
ncbi:MAG: hypothetical protein IT293_10915 [Deltaproteobacteria bacterium]|nr:hypothetical protein [Deltaproteobacteria bacterium]